MKTKFQFRSTEFNCTVTKDYFINPGCYGDDLAEWLIQGLGDAGIRASDKPDQEDFGWYFTFIVNDVEHCVVVGFQPNDPATGDKWIGWIEHQTGFLGSLFGGRKRGILPEAINAVDRVLKSSPDIHNLSWHEPGSGD